MYNYDEVDYEREKVESIQENQQKIWDLWYARYLRTEKIDTPSLRYMVRKVVEDWSGHPLMIDVDLMPPKKDI